MARSTWLMVSLALAAAGASARAGEDAGVPRVRHEVLLTSPEAAADAGLIVPSTGVAAVDGGLRLESLDAMLQLPAERWSPAASNPEGWAVEARLRPLPEKGPCGPVPATIRVWDGEGMVVATLGPSAVGLSDTGQPLVTAPLAPVAAARTYRIELQGRRVSLRADGREVLSVAASPERGKDHTTGQVVFEGPRCTGAVTEWEAIAWETAPYPVPPGLDPRVMNPRVESAAALEALASGLSPQNAAAVRALSLSPVSLTCAARTAVDDAVRLGARHAFEAQVHPPRLRSPPLEVARNPRDCGPDPMPGDEVIARARLAARALAKLPSTLAPDALERAREALAAPPAQPPPPPPAPDLLERSGDRPERRGPICDPAGPCDCRPRPSPVFPYPPEVAAATRAVDLVRGWPDHPQNVYDALAAASAALTSPGDQAQLVAHLKAIASGKRTCR
ncbi:MAG TPA: hypothetical protein VFA20_27050 [Myxococcaceae bacterium]|nr:hypothetical protein [Myxococcaceae bacterium]